MSKITVIKIGTESLQDFHTSKKVGSLVQGIVDAIRQDIQVLLVTSGSVQFGREALGVEKTEDENKSMLAGIGWHRLMHAYEEKFAHYATQVAGLLVTHADIEDSEERGKLLKNTVTTIWKNGIIPVVNENDVLSVEELDALSRGGDNDKNALLLAKLLGASSLILITNTNGVYEDRCNPSSRIRSIHYTDITESQISQWCGSEKSVAGTGGMRSKLEVACEAGRFNIATHIGNGIDSGIHDIRSGGTNILAVSRI